MTFDGVFLHHMTAELAELIGGRIQKVNQPFELELLLAVRTSQGSKKLLLSAHPQFGRVQFTGENLPNPQTASTFVMILRKYLSGAIITGLQQIENDRQLIFEISSKDEIGDSVQVRLVIEIMGKHSNIILYDAASGKIIEAIKHVGFSQNSYRTILPGSDYVAPPLSDLTNPFTASDEVIFEHLQTRQKFQGMGKDTWETLSNLTVPAFKEKLLTLFPSTYDNDNFSSIQLIEPAVKFDSLSELLDTYYHGKATRDRVKQQASELIRKVDNELTKSENKLKKQLQELADSDDAEIFRQKGELLNNNLTAIPASADSITLDNYYTNEPLEIALDPAYTPSQNAQRYFHRYQKLKERVKFLTGEIERTRATISYLESVSSNLTNASLSEIEDIREELVTTGFLKKRKNTTGKKHKALPPERYTAPDGSVILVGKNNIQNEEVSFKRAKKGDLWFHVKDLPSAHVLLQARPDGSTSHDDETITFAGELAAYFSKQRDSNLVQVDVLEAKKLHKPTGTPPGFVTYNREKTIRVTPDPEKIEKRKD
ncbi:MAG: NFACT family protein [Streptococcaceae bacterium]|jgi:predicted ribosome quality control (RQC) complex YloA/Tae2 family protein|nr:NFACT family protein [Streptococcaceae bacterium]